MAFMTSLGNLAGGFAEGQQRAYQNALQNKQLDLEQQQSDEQAKLEAAQLAQIDRQNQQQQSNRQFESGLQLPKNWSTMQPDQRIAYLTQRYDAAQRAGDDTVAQQTLAEMNSLELGAERLANANYTNKGRLPLAQAQAQWWGQRHSEVMAQLQAKFKLANAAQQAAMARAELSARTRLQASSMSNDERDYIATLTALNVANHQDENQAFQAAMAQYKSAASQWATQEKQYNLGLGADPGAAPTPQQYIVGAPAAGTPSITTVQIVLPDGTVRNAPVVQSNLPKPNFDAHTYITKVQQLAKSGTPPAKIRQMLQQSVQGGYLTQQQMDGILKSAGVPSTAPTSGGGF